MVTTNNGEDINGDNDSTITTPNGASQTLEVELDKRCKLCGATNIKTFSGGAEKLKGVNLTVNPKAGSVSSFDYGGNTFNAYFSASTGAFLGYNTITSEGTLQSYEDFHKNYTAEPSSSAGELFSAMKSAFNWAWHWGSPIKGSDSYISVQIKDEKSITYPENGFIESSKLSLTILGLQGDIIQIMAVVFMAKLSH